MDQQVDVVGPSIGENDNTRVQYVIMRVTLSSRVRAIARGEVRLSLFPRLMSGSPAPLKYSAYHSLLAFEGIR